MRGTLFGLGLLLTWLGFAVPAMSQSIAPTPQLPALTGVRISFVSIRADGLCKLDRESIVADMKRNLAQANIQSADGFDSLVPDWPIMEVSIDAFGLVKSCSLHVGILIRANTAGAKIEGNHYFEYQPIWRAQVFPRLLEAESLDRSVRALLLLQMFQLVADIRTAKQLFPDL